MTSKRLVPGLVTALVLLASNLTAIPAQAAWDRTADDQTINVIVTLADQADVTALGGATPADRQRHLIEALRRTTDLAQSDLIAYLRQQAARGQVQAFAPLWINNAVAMTAARHVILDLARRSDVVRIELDRSFDLPRHSAPLDQSAIEPNLIMINAPAVWARGITGQGVVVALLDSGVDMTSPDLAAHWRGGSNSWFDPYDEHPGAPVDTAGHGTQMLGVILGGGDGGSRLGVAPGAKWIAARIFNDRGRATTSAIHRALQWVLDPDGNPATPDAPQVVNNSWSFVNAGCSDEFSQDLRALRAAGILPVFAAGVNEPVSPANTAEAFAVGAVSDDHTLSPDSAQGPSKCDTTMPVYPQIVAPGTNIHTTDRYNAYTQVSGTSIAAAHVSGALALLLSAKHGLSADEQASILTSTAVDLGAPGPDDRFGYGRLDIAAMIDRVLGPAPTDQAIGVSIPMVIIGSVLGFAVVFVVMRRTRSMG
jgi:subtilisin family serine protease